MSRPQIIPTADVVIAPEKLHEKQPYYYLSVFDNKNWFPIHWAERGNPVVFTSMGKNIVYMPLCVVKDRFSYGTPFIFTVDAHIHWLEADTLQKQTLKLTRKHPLLSYWMNRMTGGEYHAAHKSDFSDATVIHTITDKPDLFREIIFDQPQTFRYYRFFSSNAWGGNIAELEFYSGKDYQPITGKMIGTPGSYMGLPRTFDKVFDGDVLTFFDPPMPDSAWVGMDFGREIPITKIRYLPRNDDNNVVPGQLYELFYWEHGHWKSLGQQIATDQALYYDNAPVNALFLLRNLTKGKEERVFTYENEKQIWW
jgi:hypothetical protein